MKTIKKIKLTMASALALLGFLSLGANLKSEKMHPQGTCQDGEEQHFPHLRPIPFLAPIDARNSTPDPLIPGILVPKGYRVMARYGKDEPLYGAKKESLTFFGQAIQGKDRCPPSGIEPKDLEQGLISFEPKKKSPNFYGYYGFNRDGIATICIPFPLVKKYNLATPEQLYHPCFPENTKHSVSWFQINRDGKILHKMYNEDYGPDYGYLGIMRIIAKDGKVGFVNSAGCILVPPVFAWTNPVDHNGIASIYEKKDKLAAPLKRCACSADYVPNNIIGFVTSGGMLYLAPKKRHPQDLGKDFDASFNALNLDAKTRAQLRHENEQKGAWVCPTIVEKNGKLFILIGKNKGKDFAFYPLIKAPEMPKDGGIFWVRDLLMKFLR